MWKDLIKQLQPANKMHGFAFRTPVTYNDSTYHEGQGFYGKQKAIIEWEFSFGQRETYMREVSVYVTKIILPDETELSQKIIDDINGNSVDIVDKTSPSDLYKYGDDDYELIW